MKQFNIDEVIKTAEHELAPDGISNKDFAQLEKYGWKCISEKNNLFISDDDTILLHIFTPMSLINKYERSKLVKKYSYIFKLVLIDHSDKSKSRITDYIGIEYNDDLISTIRKYCTQLINDYFYDDFDQHNTSEIPVEDNSEEYSNSIHNYLELIDVNDLKKLIRNLSRTNEDNKELEKIENEYKINLLDLYITKKSELH